jgi:hypothetical protein
VAARMYGMNLATWGDRALALGLAEPGELERVAAGLAGLAGGSDGSGGRGKVRWVLRQIVVGA